ncbi:hypothetical protein D3C76_875820 [compost metagenome]
MRRVQFNQVEPGFTGIGDGLAEIIHDARDFVEFQRARGRSIDADRMTVFITQRRTCTCIQRGSGNRCLPARLDAVVRDTARMPQLNCDAAIISMNACSDFFPRSDLLRAVQTRCASIAFRLSGDLSGFGNDQARAGTLTIVFAHQRGRDITRLNAAQTSQRGHQYAIWCSNRTDFQWGK